MKTKESRGNGLSGLEDVDRDPPTGQGWHGADPIAETPARAWDQEGLLLLLSIFACYVGLLDTHRERKKSQQQ